MGKIIGMTLARPLGGSRHGRWRPKVMRTKRVDALLRPVVGLPRLGERWSDRWLSGRPSPIPRYSLFD